jgi:flagellar secretion chaperone FliS
MVSGSQNPYQVSAIEHADPVKLVGLMYEGAIRFIRRAEKSITDGDPEGAHNNIMRAYAIVAELMATLDFEHGGEIAVNLEQCYEYVLHLLKEANIKKDAPALATARTLLEPLLLTWNDAFANGNATVSIPQQSGEAAAKSAVPDNPVQVAAPRDAVASGAAVNGGATVARKSLDLVG